jgi:hypothetical protein
MSTESSVPVTTTVLTTTSTPDITTTVVTTPLTEQEKIDLYNKYKAELTYVEFYSTIGKYMTLGVCIALLFSLFAWLFIDRKSNKILRYSVLVWLLLAFISLIGSAAMCLIALETEVMKSGNYQDNYDIMYNNAANSQELINFYKQLVGRKREKNETCQRCTGRPRYCYQVPCSDAFVKSGSNDATTAGAVFSIIASVGTLIFAVTWYYNRISIE